jgi:hypothetical protein
MAAYMFWVHVNKGKTFYDLETVTKSKSQGEL